MSHYEMFFGQSADAMCELNATGGIRRANRACRHLLGSGAVDDVHLLSLHDPAPRTEWAQIVSTLGPDSPTSAFEGRLVATGAWIQWRLTWLAPDRIVGVGRDMSTHDAMARALADKTAFLHSVIEAEPECVKLVDRDGTLLDMNRAGLSMVGAKTRSEAVGHSVYDLVDVLDRERFIAFNAMICDGGRGELSYDIIGLDGMRRSMETTAVPFPRTPDGEIVHLAITRDVTERRQLEGQLRQAQKMEAIGQLAGGVAHDFNNLLTAIIGTADLCLDDLEPGTELAEDLAQIKSTGERAARLTQQLLAFARRQVVQLEPLSLGSLVEDSREMLDRLLGEPYTLDVDIAGQLGAVHADRGHLEQVLLNLVVNARDAIEGSGHIEIAVANTTLDPDRAGRLGCDPGLHVALSVTDDGRGICGDDLPHVFDPFFTTKPTGEGSGLGLSTCYGIVTQLGGAIDVRSEPGGGTTFIVLIPATADATALPEAPRAPARGAGETVLVVEDEQVVREAVCRMLSTLGYAVEACANGDDALLRAAELDELALVVTDMTMPGMGGRDLAAHLRQRRDDLPVLYMTGYLPDPDQHHADRADAGVEVLQKPFTSQALSLAVARAMHGASGQPPRTSPAA